MGRLSRTSQNFILFIDTYFLSVLNPRSMKYTIKSLGFLLLFSSVAMGQAVSQDRNIKVEQDPRFKNLEQSQKKAPASLDNSLLYDLTYDFEAGYPNGTYFSGEPGFLRFDTGQPGDTVANVNNYFQIVQAIDTTYLDSYSLMSPDINDSEAVNIKFFVKVAPGGGDLQFRYKVSSEPGWDYLHVEVDGNRILDESGEIPWTQSGLYSLSEGVREIDFWYSKDGSNSAGIDAAFVDNISIFNADGSLARITKVEPVASAKGQVINLYGSGLTTENISNRVYFGDTGYYWFNLAQSDNKMTFQVNENLSPGNYDLTLSTIIGEYTYPDLFTVLDQTNASFGSQNLITNSSDAAFDVYPADLDGDGDQDVLTASGIDNTISWFANNGDGTFGSESLITINASDARKVRAADFDGDGDLDVVYTTANNQLVWYENDGAGNFFTETILSSGFYSGLNGLHTADIDGDGDVDILITSLFDNRIDWYENFGDATFAPAVNISTSATQPQNVYTADLDNDGDLDVISAASGVEIAWYPNNGDGTFAASTNIGGGDVATDVFASDLDNDGDMDILSSSINDDRIAWYENFGDGTFSNQNIISNIADGAASVYTADLDGDGDQDVLSASTFDDKIAWYESFGDGTFGSQQIITDLADGANTVIAADLDGDGDLDVLTASEFNDEISWYENTGIPLVTPSLPITFDDSGVFYDFIDFGGNSSRVVQDPENSSNLVAETVRSQLAENIAGTTMDLAEAIPFSSGNTLMSVRVWSPAAGIPILLKAENTSDINISVETQVNTTTSGGWETLYFDFSNHLDGTSAINFGTTGADAGEQTYYWDDIEFIGNLPVTPIADVRNASLGTTLKTKGVVTRVLGNNISIQDGNSGLHVFAPSASAIDTAIINGDIVAGDSLIVTGQLTEFNSLLEFDNVTDFSVPSRNNALPEPQEITLADLGEEYESELVKITNISTPSSGTFTNDTSYDLIQDGVTYPSTMRIGGAIQNELDGVEIPSLFNYVGVLRQSTLATASANGGYQLTPTYEEDIAAGLNFAISKVFPEAAAPGTNITIYGKGFDSNPTSNAVSIGGFSADVVEASATKLVVTVPAVSPGNAEVSVTANSFSETYAGNFTSLQPISANFATQSVISTLGDAAYSVFATDLDGDGDLDVISASYTDDKIAWYQNNGDGTFGTQTVISTLANGPSSVYAADLDGDGDQDVLSASSFDDKIAWYQNNGDGTFASQTVISTLADGAESVYAIDLDNDGDIDVLSASKSDDKIAWYENNGDGTFGAQTTISTLTSSGRSVYAADLDGDGDQDVLSASFFDDKIAWYQNNGDGTFGAQTIISTFADGAQSVYAIDLDGDGDLDVLSASSLDDKIAWYENNGDGTFGAQTIISTLADGANTVYAADLDSDGDLDVLSASRLDDKIAWYENTGTLSVNLSSIADARLTTKGSYIRVRGIVTRRTDNIFKLQDGSAGLHVYRAADFNDVVFGQNIQEGDSLEILGQRSEFGGLMEIVNIQEYTSLSTGNTLPDPITITLDDVSETYESVLVRINDLSTDSTGSTFREFTSYDLYESDILNQNSFLYASGPLFTNILGTEIPETFAFEGIVSEGEVGDYRLEPINQTDIIDLSVSPPSNVVANEAASSINLSWDQSLSVNASGYNIYRATEPFTDSTSATKINPSLLTGTSFVDSNVQANTRYYYRIATYSSDLNIQSDLSNEATSGFDIISVYGINTTAADAGTSITIYGTNLPTTAGSVLVDIGEIDAPVVTQLPNQIVVTVPSITPGNHEVLVTVSGTIFLPLPDLFTVLETTAGESGFFQEANSILPSGILGATTLRAIDLDSDLDNDILASLYNQSAGENLISLANQGDGSFSGVQSIGNEGNLGARDVVYADFDGDTLIDIAAVYDRSLIWYSNNGDGSFGLVSTSTVQSFPERVGNDYSEQSLLAFDADGDGDIDLIHSSRITDDIFLYQNDGTGNFTTQVTVDSNAPLVNDIAGVDINEDGRFEIIATLEGTDQLVYYPNNGSSFGGRTLITSSFDLPRNVIAGNIDGDSDVDLLTISQTDSKVAWYSNNAGSGSFSTQKIISEDLIDPTTAAVGDLNGDGLLEVVVGTLNGDVVLYRNLGSENFSAAEYLVTGAGEIRALAISDLNGDGDLDILASDYTSNSILQINNVDPPPDAPTGITASRDIGSVILNWDANSDTDLQGYEIYRSVEPVDNYVSVSNGVQTETSFTDNDITNAVTYYYRVASVDDNGTQTRSDSVAIKAISTQIANIEPLAGVAGNIIRISGVGISGSTTVNFGNTSANVIDTYPNLVTVEVPSGLSGTTDISITTNGINYNYPAPFRLLTENDGTFSSPTETAGGGGGTGSIASADLDSDGLEDLVVTRPDLNQIGLYYSDGSNPYSQLRNINLGSSIDPNIIKPTSIFGTDYPDFVFTSYQDNVFHVLKNNGSTNRSSFLDLTSITVSHSGITDIASADINDDGYEDVIISSSNDGKISWYENTSVNSSVSFGAENIVASSAGNIRSIYAGDFNGDRLVDVVAAIQGRNIIAAYYNNGDGSFTETTLTGINFPEKVIGSDLDNDGDLDLIYASSDDDLIEVLINSDSQGSFTTITGGSGISGASDVAIADLDGDGLKDIITSSPNTREAFWFRNTGNGSFSSSNNLGSSSTSIDRVVATDMDGNGRLDVAYRSNSSSQIGLFRNFTINPLQITRLDAGSNNIIRVNQGFSLFFNSSNGINSIPNFTDFFSGAITITTRTGESLPVGDLSISGNELLVENMSFYALDTLSVEVSSQVVSDNSGGQYFIDTDDDGQQTSSDDVFASQDFYTTMIGDFTADFEVNLTDLVSFGNGWRSDNFSFETGPLDFSSSSFPYARLAPDNNFNVDDIVAFIRYWNLTQERNKAAKANSFAALRKSFNGTNTTARTTSRQTNGRNELDGTSDINKTATGPSSASKELMDEIFADSLTFISYKKVETQAEYVTNPSQAKREVTYDFSLSHPDSVEGLSLIIDYDEDKLTLEGVEDRGLFDIHSENANVFLSHADTANGILTLNIANFGTLSSITDRDMVSVTFSALSDEDSEMVISSDIRARNQPSLQQTAMKAVQVREDLPETFTLSQNYPNPFNPSTSIHYELAEQAKVSLTVYDILGRKIETLLNENSIRAGYYKVNWDASRYASGMYIYVLNVQSQSGKFYTATKKMMMVK
ncbi:MAG: hypothetical protein CL667_09415 [Balneola sp.]|nr:hypothetical protein [Balneola sp.]